MKRCVALMLVCVLLLCGCAQGSAKKEYTAIEIVTALKDAGFPIDNVIEYTEETDPNNQLGRPNGYTEKVNFADIRAEQIDDFDPVGGSIEVFENEADCTRRREYCETIFEASPLLAMYSYQFDTVYFRLDRKLTPTQAAQYETALQELFEVGAITAVEIATPTPEPTATPEPTQEPSPEPTASSDVHIPALTSEQWGLVFFLTEAAFTQHDVYKDVSIEFLDDSADIRLIIVVIEFASPIDRSKTSDENGLLFLRAALESINRFAQVYDDEIADCVDGGSFGGVFDAYAASVGMYDSNGTVYEYYMSAGTQEPIRKN